MFSSAGVLGPQTGQDRGKGPTREALQVQEGIANEWQAGHRSTAEKKKTNMKRLFIIRKHENQVKYAKRYDWFGTILLFC
jgi:hypothetical protein